jgi:hypothetical protein
VIYCSATRRLTRQIDREALERLRDYIEQGSLVPVVRRVIRFEHGAEAFDGRFMSGGTVVCVRE